MIRERLSFYLALAVVCWALAACGRSAADDRTSTESAKPVRGKTYALALEGFNYTNRYIDNYEVDGASGANVDPSTPTAGGSKTTCCVSWVDGTYLPQTVHVRWVSAGCMAPVTNSFGNTRNVVVHTYSEADVQLNGPIPSNPSNFETHFYPDGHVEVAITSDLSEPRLKLSPDRRLPESEEYPPCRKKP